MDLLLGGLANREWLISASNDGQDSGELNRRGTAKTALIDYSVTFVTKLYIIEYPRQQEQAPMTLDSALQLLNDSIIQYKGEPVGTSAACDPNPVAANYTECFVRDFVPSALVFLMRGEPDIVRNFLTTVMRLRGQQPVLAGHGRSRGLMPASFKVANAENVQCASHKSLLRCSTFPCAPATMTN